MAVHREAIGASILSGWKLVNHGFFHDLFCIKNNINTSKRKFLLYSRQQKHNRLKFQLKAKGAAQQKQIC